MSGILLLGAGGLLGQAFSKALKDREVVRAGRKELSGDPAAALQRLFKNSSPALVINCAAHTDLEAAEKNPEVDFAVNVEFPGTVASLCKQNGALMLHFSSAGCYGDWKSTPYSDSDPVRPTSAHHKAKVAGEHAIAKSGCRFVILRTGWLYGGAPGQTKNFVWNRIADGRTKSEMICDAAQRGCPTWVDDLVRQAMLIVERKLEGTFNAVAQGQASRCDYIAEIILAAALPCAVKPGPRFERLAKVSMNETAENTRLKQLGIDVMPYWKVSLRRYVQSVTAPVH